MHKKSGDIDDCAPHVLPRTNVVAFPNTAPRSVEKDLHRRQKGVALTKAAVKKLALPAGKDDVVFWDSTLPGFGLRIRKGGKRTYMVQFRDSGKNTRKVVIGNADVRDADDARAEAKKLLGGVATGNDPAKAKREARQATKLGEVMGQYLAHAAGKQKASTLKETTRNLKIHAKPLHSSAIRSIDRMAIAGLHEKITASSGPTQANRVLAALSTLFTWSIGKGFIDNNPVFAVPKNAEISRERALSDAEIRAIWKATEPDTDYNRIIRLLLLTGCRRSEVGGMQWSELLEIAAGTLWTVPGARMKNGLPHEVPLPERAVACLPAPKDGHSFVFGRRDTGFSGWSAAKKRLDKAVKFSNWGLHDFRRTLSTRLNEHGIMPHVVEAILAHISGAAKGGIAGVYNKAGYREQKTETLQIWSEMIEKIVAKDDG
jgi:integrase